MRNLGLATVALVGLINIDQLYYHGAMLTPIGHYIWRHVAHLFVA